MTRHAPLGLYRFMLKDERPALIAVALEADHILVGGRAKLAIPRCPVCIVAIRALDQTFLDAMMERLLEIGSLLDVAREAQRSLILFQLVFQFRVVYGVAGCAGNTVFVVSRSQEFSLFRIRLVAGQASPADVLRSRLFESEYFAFVAASIDVRRAGSMA
ncbi:MAG TPA: hypothetical protein VM578_03430 [Candidatus Saccharimonadales bacterium]|nr:hypothetical protein [Candidatus Saccharimonadales bacterium]